MCEDKDKKEVKREGKVKEKEGKVKLGCTIRCKTPEEHYSWGKKVVWRGH